MCNQPYLFPELSPVKPSKKSKKDAAATKLPKVLMPEDFFSVPNAGFPELETITISRNDSDAPFQYVCNFIRRLVPTHMAALAEYKNRFVNLRRCLAEEYVRLHARSEKAHPEWFEGGQPVNPEKTEFLPFAYNPDSRVKGMILDAYSGYNCEERGIPLSVCADLVRELNIHYPTYNPRPDGRDPDKSCIATFDLTEETRINFGKRWDTDMLILKAGTVQSVLDVYDAEEKDQGQKRYFFLYNDRHNSLRIPQGLPDTFGKLSQIYALESMSLFNRSRYFMHCFLFRILSVNERDAEKEKQELMDAVQKAISSWDQLTFETMKALAGQAEKNILSEERKLMGLLYPEGEKPCT